MEAIIFLGIAAVILSIVLGIAKGMKNTADCKEANESIEQQLKEKGFNIEKKVGLLAKVYVLGFDCNIPRLQRASRQSIENQAHIVCFSYPKAVIEKYCWADVRTCDLSEVERVFRLPRISDRRSNEPFKAKGGKYIDVPPKKLL